jgi:hypothetical protein
MTIEAASVFLIDSILLSLGILVLICGTILVNNLLAKYWKPVKLWTWDYKFIEVPIQEEPKIEPVVEKQQSKK